MQENMILVSVLIGMVVFATAVVIWQISITFGEVRETLKAFRDLSRQLQSDLDPTMKELTDLSERMRMLLDTVEDAKNSLDGFVSKTKYVAGEVIDTSRDYFCVLKTGIRKGLEVYFSGNSTTETPPSLPAGLSSETVEITSDKAN